MRLLCFAVTFIAVLAAPLRGSASDLSTRPGMLQAFGFNQFNVPQQIPALAILMTYRDRANFLPEHPPEYFRQILFGETPSVRDYFLANSNGRFTMNPADHPQSARTRAVIGPFRNTDISSTSVNEELFDCAFGGLTNCPGSEGGDVAMRRRAVALAALNGFDFGPFDANRNGVVETTELLVVLVHAGAGGGAVRGPACTTVLSPTRGWIQVCVKMTMIHEGGSTGLFAHEISHQLGTVDLYGCWDCATKVNEGVTNMSMDRPFLHFDPLHKIQLGWATPRIYDLAQGDDCVQLAAQSASPEFLQDKRPVILYDSRHPEGAREFFILEYRTPRPLLRGDPHDRELEGGEGLALWHVRRGGNGGLLNLPYLIIPKIGTHVTSTRLGDDEILSRDMNANPAALFFGDNSRLESLLDSSHDKSFAAAFNLLVPANGGALGSSVNKADRFWGASHDAFALAWVGDSVGLSPVRRNVPAWLRASNARVNDPSISVRWSALSGVFLPDDMARRDPPGTQCWRRTDPPTITDDRLERNNEDRFATALRPFPMDSRPGLTFSSVVPGSMRSNDIDFFRLQLDRNTGLSIRVRHDPLMPIRVRLFGEIGEIDRRLYTNPVPLINNYGSETVYTWYTLPSGRYNAILDSQFAQNYDLTVESGDHLYHPPAVARVSVSPQCFENPEYPKKSKAMAIGGDTLTITTRIRVRMPPTQSLALVTLSTDSPAARITSGNYIFIDSESPDEWDVSIETPLSAQFNLIITIPTRESILTTHRIPMGVNGIASQPGKVLTCDDFLRVQSEFAKLAEALETLAVQSFTPLNKQRTPVPGYFPIPPVGYLPKYFQETPVLSRWASELDRLPGDRPPLSALVPFAKTGDTTKFILEAYEKLGVLPVEGKPKK